MRVEKDHLCSAGMIILFIIMFEVLCRCIVYLSTKTSVDEHVTRAPQVPSQKRNVAQRGLRDDSELIRQGPEEDRDVVDALMIGHEHVRASRLESAQALDLHTYARCHQDES